jgi:DNA-binding Lrp family transcriptional regulator
MEADLSIAQISQQSRQPTHVVRSALSFLQNNEIIQRRAYMNSFLIGTAPYLVALSLTSDGRKKRKQIAQYLYSSPHTSYVAMVGGNYSIFVEIRSNSIYGVQAFLDNLSTTFGSVFSQKEVLALTSMSDFSVFAAPTSRGSAREFTTIASDELYPLEEMDKQILRGLSQKWEDSVASLSRKLGAPTSTVEYRLSKLRCGGVLIGSRYFVNLFALGYQVFYHVCTIRGFHPELRAHLKTFARRDPAVHTFRTFLGAWDIIFECHYESAADVISFVERLTETYGDRIETIDSLPVLSSEKVSDCTV